MERPGVETQLPPGFVGGNHFDKYGSRNPIHRALVGGFIRCAGDLMSVARPARVLEVGCGRGDLAWRLFGGEPCVDYVGIDVSPPEVRAARARFPRWSFQVASAYDLPFPDGSFDMVMACEVLEHLGRPEDALRSMGRVCRSFVLVSVPWEPLWRVLNLARGKYWSRLGDTPGHVQHFSRRRIRKLVASHFEVVALRRPFPWTMLLAAPRRRPSHSATG